MRLAWRNAILWSAIVGLLVLRTFTLPFAPAQEPDAQLYASIARSWSQNGSGVPTLISNAPNAVDHVAFYGPVYLELTALSFKAFGMSRTSVRLVSLFGALILMISAAGLAMALGGSRSAWLWSILMILLTPEVQRASGDGTMATLAVGLAIAALALFARSLPPRKRMADWMAAGAGTLMGLAVLTTPRIYPFTFAFVVAGVLWFGRDRDARRRLVAAIACLALIVGAWAVLYHGSIGAWAHMILYVLTHEDSDVAIVGSRMWMFTPSRGITPIFAAVAAVPAAWLLDRARKRKHPQVAAEFALGTVVMTFVLMVAGTNLTFLSGIYFGIPLLVVLMAMPWPRLGVPERVTGVAVAALATVLVAFAARGYARVAVSWDARNPYRMQAFIQEHVPEGSAIIGPQGRYFFVVEGAGASYLTTEATSFADWARWMPEINPAAMKAVRRPPPLAAPGRRFLFWPDGENWPDGYACALEHRTSTYHRPPYKFPMLNAVVNAAQIGYPAVSLYELPAGCPTGYDPTAPAAVID